MKSLNLLVVGLLLSSCSVHHAMNVPPPVEYKKVTLGSQRAEVVSLLGTPKYTRKSGEYETDYYEFTDGYHGASKLRIVPYIAAGIFTAGLSEIIFYPIEAGLIDGEACLAQVTYDKDEKIFNYKITDKDNGKVLWTGGTVIPPPQKKVEAKPVETPAKASTYTENYPYYTSVAQSTEPVEMRLDRGSYALRPVNPGKPVGFTGTFVEMCSTGHVVITDGMMLKDAMTDAKNKGCVFTSDTDSVTFMGPVGKFTYHAKDGKIYARSGN